MWGGGGGRCGEGVRNWENNTISNIAVSKSSQNSRKKIAKEISFIYLFIIIFFYLMSFFLFQVICSSTPNDKKIFSLLTASLLA